MDGFSACVGPSKTCEGQWMQKLLYIHLETGGDGCKGFIGIILLSSLLKTNVSNEKSSWLVSRYIYIYRDEMLPSHIGIIVNQ